MARRALVVIIAAVSAACFRYEPDTPLAQAAARDDVPALRAVLAAGADPNAFDRYGGTALIAAARTGHVAAAEALIAGGARVDLPDRRSTRWTPLMHAVHERQAGTARVLLDHGADPNARTGGG